MPPAIIGGAIAAGGAVLASKSASKGTKQAAEAQERSTAEQTALQREIYEKNEGALSPFMQRGNMAGDTFNALLGLGGPGATFGQPGTTSPQDRAMEAYSIFKNSTGYQNRFNEGMQALNAGFAGRGVLQSGAAAKAALRYGQDYASNELGNYLGYLGNQQGVGLSGASALAGVGQSYANNVGAISQNNATVQGQAAIANARNQAGLITGLTGIAGNVLGGLSSYGQPQYRPPGSVNTPGYGIY